MEIKHLQMIKNHLEKEFCAREATSEVCRAYLDKGDKLLFGLTFCDKAKNFLLMSDTDFMAYTKAEAEEIREKAESPDGEILLIFYERDGERDLKIVNGMASKLYEIVEELSENR